MCLAIPGQVKSIDGPIADVDIGGVSRQINVMFTPEVKIGDYVLIHTGYAINLIDKEEAAETLRLLEELGEPI